MSPSATPATQSDGQCRSPSATPATQTGAASTAPTGTQARHQSQPSPISVTPATQNARPCRQVPRLPRKVMVDIAKCHPCHGVQVVCEQVV